jgi:signal peptidase II
MLAVIVLDRLSKLWIIGHFSIFDSYPLIEGFLAFTYIQNTGAAFGILEGRRWLFMLIAGAVLTGMVCFQLRFRLALPVQLAMGCVGGGACGNMFDRFYYGAVVDFISIGWWPIFNLADVAIVSGCTGLALLILLERKEDAA